MSARDQVTRLLALVPYLDAHGEVPLARVARDFGVSAEQIRRDLNVLWYCGMPGPGQQMDFDYEALEDDPDGIVRFDAKGYLTRPVRLDAAEASALIVALRALREGAPESSREVVDRALAKLEEATTGESAAHLDVHLPSDQPRIVAALARLEDAISADRQVRIDYYVPTRDETTQRSVDPVALLRSDGKDYLDAWCHVAEARRLFRVSRIHSVDVLEERRAQPDIEPRDLTEGLFEPSADDHTALIRLAPWLAWFVDYYPVTASRELPDGGIEAELRVGDPRWLARLVLRLAPGLEVLEPSAIRDLARRTALDTLALYGHSVE